MSAPLHFAICKNVLMAISPVKYGWYLWALPTTLLGILLASLAVVGGRVRVVAGVIEAHGPWLRWTLRACVPLHGGAAAITFGHVVLAQDQHALDTTRAHERVHVRQYERWGPLFLPAYVAASIFAIVTGGHYYFDNAFEREAFARQHLPPLSPLPPVILTTFEFASSAGRVAPEPEGPKMSRAR